MAGARDPIIITDGAIVNTGQLRLVPAVRNDNRWRGRRRRTISLALATALLTSGLAVGGVSPALADDTDESGNTTVVDPVPSEDSGSETQTGEAESGSTTQSGDQDSEQSGTAPVQTQSVAPLSAAASAELVAKNGIPALNVQLDGTTKLTDLDGGSKDKKYAAKISLTDPTDPSHNFVDYVGEIKGRGNYTWKLAKKPYQIKFAKKDADGPGDVPLAGMTKERTWILLANHADPSLLRNNTAFEIANKLGLAATPQESRFVDLSINGTYVGTYQVTEKIEVKKSRLNLKDDSGIMVELDNSYGRAETHHFASSQSGTVFAYKESKTDLNGDDSMPAAVKVGWDDIRSDINKLDGLLYASSPNWSEISKIIDVDSFVRYYYLTELTANPEIGSSSVYFYKDGVGDKLHMGPAWDFDSALGAFSSKSLGADPYANYTNNVKWLRGTGTDWYAQLSRNPQFVRALYATYDSEASPAYAAAEQSITTMSATLSKSAAANFKQWNILGKPSLLFNHDRTWKST
uniref:CotH kinase family protein n=1 Tax=Actinomyces polynesiensis TaxID=1325934 RepID=UPI00164EA5CB